MAAVEPVLLTRRLALRRFTAADVGNLLELDGDPAVMRFIQRTTKSCAEVGRHPAAGVARSPNPRAGGPGNAGVSRCLPDTTCVASSR
jgi:hypothetical protein